MLQQLLRWMQFVELFSMVWNGGNSSNLCLHTDKKKNKRKKRCVYSCQGMAAVFSRLMNAYIIFLLGWCRYTGVLLALYSAPYSPLIAAAFVGTLVKQTAAPSPETKKKKDFGATQQHAHLHDERDSCHTLRASINKWKKFKKEADNNRRWAATAVWSLSLQYII